VSIDGNIHSAMRTGDPLFSQSEPAHTHVEPFADRALGWGRNPEAAGPAAPTPRDHRGNLDHPAGMPAISIRPGASTGFRGRETSSGPVAPALRLRK